MKVLILAVCNVFKYVGRFFTVIRNFLLNVLFLVAVIAIVFAFIPREVAQIPIGAVLRLDVSGDIVEEKKLLSSFEKLFGESFSLDAPEPETALQDILDTINNGAADDRIAVLLLNLKDMASAGLNQLLTIGAALDRFKQTGKSVVAVEDYFTQAQYLLAAHATKVMVNPMGGVDLHGFGVYHLYFKDALEKLKINYNVFKVGTYKSALEPFTRESMSPADQQQNEQWLTALWQVYTGAIAKQRNISPTAIQLYTDNIAEALRSTGGNTAQLALATGLVDQIATRQEAAAYIDSLTPIAAGVAKIVASADYLDAMPPSYQEVTSKQSKVGLIIAEGTILPGKQPPGMIGGDSLAQLIKNARENEAVKTLVLRINSGGGSAFASEIIRQELLELKKSGKPLVVSMGAVAASGGYWIAADADEIWASPATITGSIGIFGAIPTFERTLAAIGVFRDGLGTTPLAAGLDITQPLPEALKDAIQQSIEYNYDQFLQIVANGRKITKRKVAELAEGRVYDGQTAQTLGLVDNLGSLEDAIEAAAKLAKLQDYATEYIRSPVSIKEHFLQFLTTGQALLVDNQHSQLSTVTQFKKTLSRQLERILPAGDPRGVYAQCLEHLSW